MGYVKLKHTLSSITLDAIEHPDRAPVVDALAAYARHGGGQGASLDALEGAAGMRRNEVGRLLSATGLFEIHDAGHGSVTLSSPYRPFATYLSRQAGRSATALLLVRAPHDERVPEDVWRAAALFNAGLFFECHEYLEGAWRSAPDAERAFYHGLVQAAAGCYHLEKGNMHGARTLVRKAVDKLTPFAPAHRGLDVAALLAGLRRLDQQPPEETTRADPAQGSVSPPWNPGLTPAYG